MEVLTMPKGKGYGKPVKKMSKGMKKLPKAVQNKILKKKWWLIRKDASVRVVQKKERNEYKVAFKTSTFKKLGKIISSIFPAPIAWILMAYLFDFEDKYLETKTKLAVDKAIADYKKDLDELPKTIVTKKPSEVDGLFDIEIKRLED